MEKLLLTERVKIFEIFVVKMINFYMCCCKATL